MYKLTLRGCDDSTTIDQDLSPADLVLLVKLAQAFNAASGYGCQPRMDIQDAAGIYVVDCDS